MQIGQVTLSRPEHTHEWFMCFDLSHCIYDLVGCEVMLSLLMSAAVEGTQIRTKLFILHARLLKLFMLHFKQVAAEWAPSTVQVLPGCPKL